MSGIFSRRLLTATRYALLEQGRNRLALGLLLVFVPLWYSLFLLLTQGTTLVIKDWSTSQLLSVDGGNLTLLTAGLNAITLIVGFMFFASTERGMPFDRLLVRGSDLWWVRSAARGSGHQRTGGFLPGDYGESDRYQLTKSSR